jgi:hypothetical protein
MVTLNGHGPYRFILDTGAMISVIDASLAHELELPIVGETELASPAGGTPVTSSVLNIDEVQLDAAVFNNVQTAEMDLRSLLKDPNAPQGVLSAALFRGMLLTFDYPLSQIRFEPGALGPADGSEIFQYEASDGLPTIPISFAGITVDAHLDTGSHAGFVLPGRYQDKLPLEAPPVEVARVEVVGREFPIFGSRLIGDARFGRYSYPNPEVRFGEFLPVGNIGYEILGRFSVTLDIQNRRLKMEQRLEAGAGPATRPRRYGVAFHDFGSSPLRVAGVDRDSVAQHAGLMFDDSIVKMNGQPIESLSTADRMMMLRGSPLVLMVQRGDQVLEISMSLE